MNDPVPDTNQEVWLERNQLLGEYLPRIGASPDFFSKKALACELACKLFDSWAGRRIHDVKSPADLPAFEADQDQQGIMIERSYLSDIAVYTIADSSVNVAIAGRKRHWYAEAVRRLGAGGASSNAKLNPLVTPDAVVMASGPARGPLTLETAQDRKAAVQAYIQEVWDATGNRITKADIWRKARYKTRSEFERWERKDPKATNAAHQRFSRLLAEKPHLK